MDKDDGRVPSEPGCEAPPSASQEAVFAESHPSRGRQLLDRLDSVLKMDAPTATDRQWTDLLCEAHNARDFIAGVVASEWTGARP